MRPRLHERDGERSSIDREKLAAEIGRLVERRGVSQAAAARISGDNPSQMSLLLSGNYAGFSAERLVRWLTLLGADVDIVVRERPDHSAGQVRIRRG